MKQQTKTVVLVSAVVVVAAGIVAWYRYGSKVLAALAAFKSSAKGSK